MTRTSLKLLLATPAALTFLACSSAEDTQSATAGITSPMLSESANEQASKPADGMPARGPERMIQRHDQDGDGKLQLSELPPHALEFIGQADTNGDGEISREELRTGMESHRQRRFANKDIDGDGRITAEEAGERWWSHMRVADSDGDAAVTMDELRAAQREGKLARRGRGKGGKGLRGGGHGDPMKRFDTNDDGKLTADEAPEMMWKHLKVADANTDGAVTREELRIAHENGTLRPRNDRGNRHGKFGKGRRDPVGRFDQNADGRLTAGEAPEEVWEHIKVADADGDGTVTREEIEVARESGVLEPRRGHGECDGSGRGRR